MTRKQWTITAAVLISLMAMVLFGRIAGGDAPGVAPSVKTQIDRLADEHDCVGLQDWFDLTRDDAPSQLGYIDDKMRDAGCYGG